MLKIRLQRTGRKHESTFRVVVTDSKNSTKSGKFLEIVGAYDPRTGKGKNVLNSDRIKHWLSVGAKATGTIHNLLVSEKVINGKKVNVLPKKTVAKKEEPVVEAAAPAHTEPAPAAEPEAPVEAPVEEAPAASETPSA